MATNPVNSGSSGSSRIDVAGIVAQLMEIERRPIAKIDTKLAASTVKISSLGQFEAKLSSFNDALRALQSVSATKRASSSNTSVAKFSAGESAAPGSYQLEVSSLATKALANISGFSSQSAALDFFNNQMSADVRQKASATVYEPTAGVFVLSLKAKESGISGAFSVGSVPAGYSVAETAAVNAAFTLDGINFIRSSNSVSDAIPGSTIDLVGLTSGVPVSLSVSKELNTDPKTAITRVADAYNELNTLYKQLTKSSIDKAERGVLNSDGSLGQIMQQINAALSVPIRGQTGNPLAGASDIGLLGLKLAEGGKLVFDEDLYKKSTSLSTTLESGIRIGFDSGSSKDLSQQIYDMLSFDGIVTTRIQTEKKIQSQLNSKKIDIEDKLTRTQQRLTSEYAALDALLFKLGSTSESLKTSLDAILNSNNK
jgi:flagellar hook-associated protein 2